MSGERVWKVLERVAREANSACDGYPRGKGDELVRAVLEERLGPLLRAGHAMRDWENEYRALNHLGKVPPSPFQGWDEALAALEREPGHEKAG